MILEYLFYFLSCTLILIIYSFYLINLFKSTIIRIKDFESIVLILMIILWIIIAVFLGFDIISRDIGLSVFIITFIPFSLFKLLKK
ncbi:hypothetical protein CP965_01650 [Halarcobacter mediterraneus]|uniref:Uncharacterized protein n=1 Tax=Halarcobacter mediterraneus TaxID=2023153 RepID=A0A4Q1AWS3_9BACT|nr:hypothetical protein [Halarcobacter mediterraneus]RXK14178.1 hypothetical protein CP965_01650 [Halarcobacter mediterraneus]